MLKRFFGHEATSIKDTQIDPVDQLVTDEMRIDAADRFIAALHRINADPDIIATAERLRPQSKPDNL